MEAKKVKMLEALFETLGNVKAASEKVGISRGIHYHWLSEDQEYLAAYEKGRDTQLDFVEAKAMERIDQGSDQMIIFFLRTRGRSRGYKIKEEEKKPAKLKSLGTKGKFAEKWGDI
jgi:hypothetical protein